MNPLAVMKLPEVLQLVRREPDGVRRISHPQRLTFDKRKNRFRRLHAQLAIVFCHFVIVMNPGPTRLNDPIQPVRDFNPHVALQVLVRDPPQRRLGGTRRNGHRLKKEGAQRQHYRGRHQKHLDVLANGGARIRLQIFIRNLLEVLHPLLDPVELFTSGNRVSQLSRRL